MGGVRETNGLVAVPEREGAVMVPSLFLFELFHFSYRNQISSCVHFSLWYDEFIK